MQQNHCCKDRLDLTNTSVNTLIVNCCCDCCCNGGGARPEPPVKEYKTMTVKVDLSNSDPTTCCSYADDALGMVPGTAAWDEFFGHYPVMFQEGKEVGKLNPNDFTKFVDGTSADITSGAAGDVMIAFPRRGLKIETVGDIMKVSMTDDPNNSDFEYLAHCRGDEKREMFYLGVYKGFKDAANKLRSLSEKMPTVSQTITLFRDQAQSNGAGYEQSGFYQLTFRQAMYILKYANLNSQSAVGMGYVSGTSPISTGGSEAKGMDWGEITGKQHVKLLGLEDFWGNVWEWIDGICTDVNGKILTSTTGFNDGGNDYSIQIQTVTSDIFGYMSKPQGTEKSGFLPAEAKGTENKHFCDYGHLYYPSIANYGGGWKDASYAGIFVIDAGCIPTVLDPHVGARLMYL